MNKMFRKCVKIYNSLAEREGNNGAEGVRRGGYN